MERRHVKGVFVQPKRTVGIFAGVFNHDEETGEIVGDLMDLVGESKIEGKLDLMEGWMDFTKTYIGGRKPIRYSFKSEGKLWVGHYEGNVDFVEVGNARCEIYQIVGRPTLNWEEIAKNSSFEMNEEMKRALKRIKENRRLELAKFPGAYKRGSDLPK